MTKETTQQTTNGTDQQAPNVTDQQPAIPEHLVALHKDYPDIAKAMEDNNRQLVERLASVVAPLAQQAEAAHRITEQTLLAQQAPELEQRRPELDAWIKQQPSSLQNFYANTLAKGSAQQKADVYRQFVDVSSRSTQNNLTDPATPMAGDWDAAVAAVKKNFIHM